MTAGCRDLRAPQRMQMSIAPLICDPVARMSGVLLRSILPGSTGSRSATATKMFFPNDQPLPRFKVPCICLRQCHPNSYSTDPDYRLSQRPESAGTASSSSSAHFSHSFQYASTCRWNRRPASIWRRAKSACGGVKYRDFVFPFRAAVRLR
jgi:hypothetical protein